MAYDPYLFKRLDAFGLSSKAALELANKFDELNTDLGGQMVPTTNVAEIADPANSDVEEVANKINELIAALITGGYMEEPE